MIEKVDTSKNMIQGLILVPTRELAMQTSFVIKELGKHKKIECMVSTGGNPVKEDIFRLYQTVHIIVATPGRILDLATRGVAQLENCRMIVLDEVDKLLSDNFKQLVGKILEIMPEKKQVSLFSATYPVAIRSFQQKYVPDPEFINLMEELTLKGVT
jgi:ATP-dependent RNA helicase DDX6/DHH1